jgi:hypothetical protein
MRVAACPRGQGLKAHERVADQVFRVFESDGEAHRARVDAGRGEGPLVELPVRG